MALSALVVSDLSKKSYFSERILFLFILVNTSDFIYYNHYLLMELKYLFVFIFFYLNIATIKTLCNKEKFVQMVQVSVYNQNVYVFIVLLLFMTIQ